MPTEKLTRGKLKEAVEAVLKVSEPSRNDDTKLILNVWHRVRPDVFFRTMSPRDRVEASLCIRAEDILTLPAAEGITRIRRKFQEAGQYAATDPAVIERRKREQKVWVDFSRTGEFKN